MNPTVVRNAVDLPQRDWDRLVADEDFYLTRNWLQLTQSLTLTPTWYLLEWDDQTLVGGVPTALVDSSTSWLLGRPDAVVRGSAAAGRPGASEFEARLGADPRQALLPSLVCGGRQQGRSRILRAHGHEDGRDVLKRLLDRTEALAHDQGAASIAFLYVDEMDIALREALHERGFDAFASAHYSWLPAPDSWGGYLSGFTSHRRRRIQAERRKIADSGVKSVMQPLQEELLPRLSELETIHMAKYGMANWRPAYSQHYFRRIMALLPGASLVSMAVSEESNEILGFTLIIQAGRTWYAHRTGFDEAQGAGLGLYYETNFYMPVERAAEVGVRAIHYGTESEEAKHSRGCAANTQYAYVRCV